MSVMEIEEQRWAPLPSSIAPAPAGFGWSQQLPSADPWWESMDTVDHHLAFDVIYGGNDQFAGAYLNSKFTEFSSAPRSWMPFTGSPDDIEGVKHTVFDGKPGRMINITSAGGGQYNVIFVPNPEGKWWSWGHGAPWDKVGKVVNGEGWKSIPADGIKRKLVALTMDPVSLHYMFILNEWKKGDVWWWGAGMDEWQVNTICDGHGINDFPEDGILKRLVSVQAHRHFHTEQVPAGQVPVYGPGDAGNPPGTPEEDSETPGQEQLEQYDPEGQGQFEGYQETYKDVTVEDPAHFVFLMVPRETGVQWKWFSHAHWTTIKDDAAKNDMRIVDLKPYDSERFSVILLKNTT